MALWLSKRGHGTGRWMLMVAGLSGALAVFLGAFVAHGLADWLEGRGLDAETVERRLAQADTAVRYHLVHSVVLLFLFIAREGLGRRLALASGGLITAGIVLFSGSLYGLVLSNRVGFAMVTPIGGLAWIAGWLAIAWAGFRVWRAGAAPPASEGRH